MTDVGGRRHYLDNHSGWYSVRDERFFVESETQLVDGHM